MKKATLLFFATILTITLSGCASDNGYTGEYENEDSSVCSCSGNIYNCDDFSSHSEAQECYESCGGVDSDVHELDRDLDGSACETL